MERGCFMVFEPLRGGVGRGGRLVSNEMLEKKGIVIQLLYLLLGTKNLTASHLELYIDDIE